MQRLQALAAQLASYDTASITLVKYQDKQQIQLFFNAMFAFCATLVHALYYLLSKHVPHAPHYGILDDEPPHCT